ncbi:alpha-amylase family glycosyl hydrolase [Pedobacter deserti]|uniref:alpha-amylase family glycosyl hydrolase n=1 Tax=Pedobacter deserti TaxID=2817382 RepID=UPI002109AB1C|nr:alpha-amylase family glycosyl hydrolase [Pedobacter sp. SYSU D00382]
MKKLSVSYLYLLLFILPFLAAGCHEAQRDSDGADTATTAANWYANAIIYNLDVETFKDSDGDGCGDFRGLTARLDYLSGLGINTIWLAPFQPTPGDDDGYDISDFKGIDERLGTMADFQAFIEAARERKIRVIMDMVLNHTSIEHKWFKEARRDTNSTYHKWYVWSATKPKDWDKGMVFPGVQNETWTFDEPTGKYYFHRFYNFQPDLNYEREDVRQMAFDVLRYWLAKGVDGFRLDAVPFIIDKPLTSSDKPEHMFELLTKIGSVVKKEKPDAVLLGEANVTAEENADYFGKDANRMQMMFNFYANQYLFYALAKGDATGLAEALEDFRVKPRAGQWAFFLRNHDEIDLDRLKDSERKLVYEKFGPEESMQLYDRGIRRRLAPMLADPALIRMSYSLLFSLPGAQMIRYGEEIGMGDDLALSERLSVRTPMQWNTTANGGFSTGKKMIRPVIAYGDYSYKQVNVAQQLSDSSSLLNFIRSLIELRKRHEEIGLGSWKVVETGSAAVFAIEYRHGNKRLVVAHNFGEKSVHADFGKTLNKESGFKALFERPAGQDPFLLPARGFQWYELD